MVGEFLLGPCPRRGAEREDVWRKNLPPCDIHSDSMSLVKAVRLGVTQSLTRRRIRDILDIRESIIYGEIAALLHIDGTTNPADVGTKPLARTTKSYPVLMRIVKGGRYDPKRSKDHAKTFED